ncbi:MAG TPA: LpqB family beta-propeller domain-containing protein [Pseudonocardiaceae bacterium]|jgi:hypothetical protein|nr:LpqB family beta-propeller domain-containing protein [Pseudonocardiaceae bacterium]
MTRRRRLPLLLAALFGLALLLVSCATIPTQTDPLPLPFGNGQSATAPVPQPPSGDNPFDLVRDWMRSAGNPVGKHAAARAYLSNSSKAGWNDALSLTIIDDLFVTDPGPPIEGHSGDEQTVIVRGHTIGLLGADNGFQPESSSLVMSIDVAKQPDGSWRITTPPDGVVMTQSEFALYYRPVKVYFFDPFYGALVPDLRYIATDPQSDEPARVMDLLFSGPSNAMANAVRTAIPNQVTTRTIPAENTSDGSIEVNLANLPDDETEHNKQLIIAQIVMSLHEVSSSPVVVESDGVSLAGHAKWVAADLPSYNATTTPNAGQPGLIAAHGKLVSLKDGSPVAGDAGDGSYQVITGAQSEDGSELALVCSAPNGQEQLRVGGYGKSDAVVELSATQLTRPTWAPGDAAGDPSKEVWTVVDGQSVVRVLNTQQNTWIANNVDASALVTFGQLTDLRLSRDGTRVAAIAGGHLLVGAVVADPQGSVTIKQVTMLQAAAITNAVSVDWLDQTTLAVATSQPNLPVVSVSVDGLTLNKYAANLTVPTSITAAEARPVVVADSAGIWQTSDSSDLWEAMVPQHDPGSPAIPFYPG